MFNSTLVQKLTMRAVLSSLVKRLKSVKCRQRITVVQESYHTEPVQRQATALTVRIFTAAELAENSSFAAVTKTVN